MKVSPMSQLQVPNNHPLTNIEVIVTRAEHQLESTTLLLEALGAKVIKAPTIKMVPPPPPQDKIYARGSWLIPQDQVKRFLWRFDWLIFTSVNAVKYAHEAWQSIGGLSGALNFSPPSNQLSRKRDTKIACIGKSTYEALQQLNIPVTLIPKSYHAEGLLSAFDNYEMKGKRVLIPRALVARELLPEALRARGTEVWITPLYQTVSAILSPELKRELIAPLQVEHRILTFTSDSTMNGLIEQLSDGELEWLKKLCPVVVIGPAIKRAAQREGFKVLAMAQPHTIQGLIQTLTQYFKS